MIKSAFIIIFLCFISVSGPKTYVKNYYKNGKMKSEGWIQQNQKNDYWFFYNENGSKKEEGHFAENKKIEWWLFYTSKGEILKKVEFKNNVEEGLSIFYKNGQIIKAARYKAGLKIKEWNTIAAYKSDNP